MISGRKISCRLLVFMLVLLMPFAHFLDFTKFLDNPVYFANCYKCNLVNVLHQGSTS